MMALRLNGRGARWRGETDGIHTPHGVVMLLARFGARVRKSHRRRREDRRVAAGQALKQRRAEFADGLLRKARELLAIALDDEAAEAAFEIGLRAPPDLA